MNFNETLAIVIENPIPLILFSFPILYIAFRDLIGARLAKKNLKKQAELMRESEEKVEELYRKLNANRSSLMQSLAELDEKFPDVSVDEIVADLKQQEDAAKKSASDNSKDPIVPNE